VNNLKKRAFIIKNQD